MKIRDGFVTNSSSTCFVVIFDEIPQSAADVKRWLCSKDPNPGFDDGVSIDDVAQLIFEDVSYQKPNDIKTLCHLFRSMQYDYYEDGRGVPDGVDPMSVPRDEDFMDLNGKRDNRASNQAMEDWTIGFVKNLLSKNGNRAIYHLSYGNDGGRSGTVADSLRYSDVLSDLAYWSRDNS